MTTRCGLRMRLAALLLVLGMVAAGAPGQVAGNAPGQGDAVTEASIVRLTASLLARSQLAHRPLDGALASDFLDRYLEALDPERMMFLETDVAQFGPHKATLAWDTLRTGSSELAHAIFKRFLVRLREREEYVGELLQTVSFEFTGDEAYPLDRDHIARPADARAARVLWRERLRVDFLQEKLGGKEPDAIRETLANRAARYVRDMEQLSRSQVLEVYLSALAKVYDPHSDYLGHEQMQELQISMNLSLFGIGARLRSVEGRCEVVNLVPGGPAMLSGRLGPGDRIVAVTQDGEPAVDVVNMSLRRIVAMIRGPKGTVVHITVIPAGEEGGKRRTVRLVRDEIKLEEQRASASVVDLPAGVDSTRRLGVVSLPSFYADLGAERGEAPGSGASATDDVQKLLARLEAEKVDGVVLDLRRNSGGSLREAIRLSGLFITQGPVVQTRGLEGSVSIATDPDPALVYGGPLVVLISRVSASASEIVAGALQDYGRAIIAGDSSTFGKGTVQSIVPLAPMMDRAGLEYAYDPGALKVTIRKFYRPGGASTQLKGVEADIIVPSTIGVRPVGEAELDNPLPWDAVAPARFQRVASVTPYLGALRDRSAKRVQGRADFAFLRRELERLKRRQADRSVSLNEAARRDELERLELRREEFRKTMAALEDGRMVTREITLAEAGSPGSKSASASPAAGGGQVAQGPAPTADSSPADAQEKVPSRDIVMHEAQRILLDYLALRDAQASLSAPAGVH